MATRTPARKRHPPLCIKNPRAHQLAEQASKRLGVNLSDAVIAALEEKLRRTERVFDRAKVEALLAEFDALPVLDDRTEDEILGYYEFGLPHSMRSQR
jgi:antitoxin VapB